MIEKKWKICIKEPFQAVVQILNWLIPSKIQDLFPIYISISLIEIVSILFSIKKIEFKNKKWLKSLRRMKKK